MNIAPTAQPSHVAPNVRRLWRYTRRALLTLLAFALFFPPLYALFADDVRDVHLSLSPVKAGTYHVVVADWGYHTAILVEQPEGWALGPPGNERARYVEYAWGDKRFYMESDYRPHALFATLVVPTASVVYVDGRPDALSLSGTRASYARTVDAPTLHRLLLALEGSFRRATDGARLAPYPAAPGYGGRFYPAHGRYVWARGCNWWTVARLSAADLARSSVGVVFSGQVGGRLKGFRRSGA